VYASASNEGKASTGNMDWKSGDSLASPLEYFVRSPSKNRRRVKEARNIMDEGPLKKSSTRDILGRKRPDKIVMENTQEVTKP